MAVCYFVGLFQGIPQAQPVSESGASTAASDGYAAVIVIVDETTGRATLSAASESGNWSFGPPASS
jgi:hypothetical protein